MKFGNKKYRLQKVKHVILHILCCIKSYNVILRLFLSALLENDSTAIRVSVNLRLSKFTVSHGSLCTSRINPASVNIWFRTIELRL